MLRNISKNKKGFTIIEVLIVLAIAGLILVIVLLAVPNLQRNNRNTQIRADANNILGYASDWATNNNGATPFVVCSDTANGKVYMSTAVLGATTNCNTVTEVGKIRTGVTIALTSNNNVTCSTTSCTYASPAVGQIAVFLKATCTGSNSIQYNDRAVAVAFKTEAATTNNDQCLGT